MNIVAPILVGVSIAVIVSMLGFILRSATWIAQQMKDNGHQLADLSHRVDRLERRDDRNPRLEADDDD